MIRKENGISTRDNTDVIYKNQTAGITLIALVVTIVVLLILAGITIQLVISDGGIFSQANRAKEQTEIAVLKDRIENIRISWIVDKTLDPSLKIDDLWNRFIAGDIIATIEDVEGPEKDENGNDVYTLNTKDGYTVEIIINETGLPEIGDIVKDGKTRIGTIKVQKHSQTDGKEAIDVTATIRNIVDGDKIVINYKLSSDESYSDENKVILDKTDKAERNITGLTNGEKYDVIIEVVDSRGNPKEPRIYKEKLGIVAGKVRVKEIKLTTEGVIEGANITAKVTVGKQIVLTATALPEEAEEKTVTWTSSDSEVTEKNVELIINGNTVTIEGKKVGEVTVTATATDGSGVVATCTLTVERYVHTPVALDDDLGYTWEEVSKIAKAISNDDENINNSTMEVFKEIDGKEYTVGLGDTMHIELSEKDYLVRIIGFNHDKLVETSAYGGENLYAGITFNSLASIGSFERKGLDAI